MRWHKKYTDEKLSYEQPLTQVLNQIVDPSANLTFIGPTKIIMSLMPYRDRYLDREAAVIHQWKELDLAQYWREQKSQKQGTFW